MKCWFRKGDASNFGRNFDFRFVNLFGQKRNEKQRSRIDFNKRRNVDRKSDFRFDPILFNEFGAKIHVFLIGKSSEQFVSNRQFNGSNFDKTTGRFRRIMFASTLFLFSMRPEIRNRR